MVIVPPGAASSSSPIRYERPPPITSTASPGPDLAGEPGRGRLDAPGRLDGDRGVPGRDGRGQAGGRADRRVRDRAPPRCRRSRRRRPPRAPRRTRRAAPPSGGRSAARTPPRRGAPARAGGRRRASRGSPSGGGRSRRRPRRPRPRPSARAAGRRRRTRRGPRRSSRPRRPAAAAAPATPRALAALWRPAVGRRTGTGPASGSRPAISSVVASRLGRRDPAEERLGGPARAAEPVGDPAGVAADPLRRRVHQRRRDDPPGPVAQPRDELGDPVVADVRDQHRRGGRGAVVRAHPRAGSTPRTRPAPPPGRRTRRDGPIPRTSGR